MIQSVGRKGRGKEVERTVNLEVSVGRVGYSAVTVSIRSEKFLERTEVDARVHDFVSIGVYVIHFYSGIP